MIVSFKGSKNGHFEDVLGSLQLDFWDGSSELVELGKSNEEDVFGVRAGSLDVDSPEAGVSEMMVDPSCVLSEGELAENVNY